VVPWPMTQPAPPQPPASEAPAPRARGRRSRRHLAIGLASVAVLGALASLAMLVFPGAIGGYAGLPVAPEPDLEAAVHELFVDADASEGVVLADATDFDWEVVGVFGPYTPHDTIVEDMGVRVPKGASNNLLYDERCLLVFRRGDRIAAWTVVARDVAECADDASRRLYSAERARFGGDRLAPYEGR
jgi:hypothetical protein